jgi:hypothetical protein
MVAYYQFSNQNFFSAHILTVNVYTEIPEILFTNIHNKKGFKCLQIQLTYWYCGNMFRPNSVSLRSLTF